MTILKQYTEIQKRIHSVDNQEKYNHLYLSENNSPNEDKLLVYLGKLQECISVLSANKNLEKKEKQFLETTAVVWIKRIKNCLEIDGWN